MLRYISVIVFLIYSTELYAVAFTYTVNGPSGAQIQLNSSGGDESLHVTNLGSINTVNTPAVIFNFDSGVGNLYVLNEGILTASALPTVVPILQSQAAAGTGSILIQNRASIIASAIGPSIIDFSATSVPVTLFQDGGGADIQSSSVNLSTQAPGPATLQLGSQALATGTVNATISGNANSVVDVENTYITSQTFNITNVGRIFSNTIGGNVFTVRNYLFGDAIIGFNDFINTATSTIRTFGGISSNNAEIFNLGTWIHDGATIQGVGLNFFNSGTYSMSNVVTPPVLILNGGVFENESTGIVNLNNGSTYNANTLNFGTFNANAGSILDGAITFFNNFGTLNLATAFTLPGSGLPNTGTVNINNGGTLTDEDGSGFVNDGIYNLNPGGTLVTNLFNNRGIFNINTNLNIPGSGLLNTGTVNVNNGGNLTDSNNSGFVNDGIYNLNPGGTIVTNQFFNRGLFNISTNFNIPGSGLLNIGTINVNNGGVITDTNSSGITNDGTYNLFSGATINTVRFTNNGFFNVYGFFSFPGADFINNGTLSVFDGGVFNDSDNTGITNNGTTNLFYGGQILTPSFLNNGIFNVYIPTLPFPVSSTVPYSVVNLFTNFHTSFPFINVPTITLNAPATTFIIQNPMTNLVTLTMAPGMMTFLEPNGSITTTTLTLNNAGTLIINGGNLSGNLVGTPASSLNVAQSFSTNGFISGLGSIYVTGGIFTINNSVTGYTLFQNSSTVVMNGGTLSGGMFGSGANSSLIIQKDFATAGTFSGIGTIQVLSGATFTINNPVIGYNLFQNLGKVIINPGGTIDGGMQGGGPGSCLVFNTDFVTRGILGDVVPLGKVIINPGARLTMNHRINTSQSTLFNYGTLALTNTQILTGGYYQTGTFVTTIQGAESNQFGQLLVHGNAVVGGTINAVLTNNAVIFDNQQTFDVIVASSLSNNGIQVITTSPNPFVQFSLDTRPGVPPNVVRLTLNRTPFGRLSGDDPLISGVAKVLDSLRLAGLCPKFREALITLRGTTSGSVLREDLSQLVPNVNGDALMTGLAVNDLIVDKIDHQLAKTHRVKSRIRYGYGYMAGDDLSSHEGTVGPIFFGNRLQQANRGLVEGYGSNTLGLGVLGDQWLNNWFKVGGALTYAQSGIKSNHHKNHTYIYSVQGTAFASLDPGCWYLDGYLSFASNRYHRNRNIRFVSSTTNSNTSGYQLAETLRAGYNIPIDIYQFTPLAVAQHFHLRQSAYTERGPGLTLRVKSDSRNLVRLGVGAKLVAELTPNDEFVPEIHALWIQDLNKNHIQLSSNFVEAGPAFLVSGPTLPRTAFNIGAGVTAQFIEDFYGIFEFNYEKRKHLSSRTVVAKLRYIF